MRYQKIQPAPSLYSLVECYFVWEGDAAEGLKVQSPPNCFTSITFNYENQYWASQHNSALTLVPRAFVSGQFTSNYTLELKGKIGVVGIVLKPCSLYNIFGVRMTQLVNSRVPLSFLPGLPEAILWAAVKEQSTDEGRIRILEELMLSYVNSAKANLSVIDEAVDHIDACKGCITVEEVATYLKVSRRYLEKKFLEKVGLSPKFYARMKRFGALSNKIANSPKIDWQEIVTEFGFHDQSHLVKEFLEFNQMNPTQYHLLHRELSRFVKE
jgi:AraC-like DNA-binding protein